MVGLTDDFCEGFGVGPEEDGEELLLGASEVVVDVSLFVLPEPVEASRR